MGRPNRCATPRRSRSGVSDSALRRVCLARLWEVSLDAQPVDLAAFVAAERRDIGQRGLQGYLSLAGLAPGAHVLHVRRKVTAADPARIADFRIPFWFSPPYQQDLALPRQ